MGGGAINITIGPGETREFSNGVTYENRSGNPVEIQYTLRGNGQQWFVTPIDGQKRLNALGSAVRDLALVLFDCKVSQQPRP